MASKITLSNPSIPPGSLILVTGANGLIASHAADQLLAAGYRVRGAVRSAAKSSYLTELFAARHGQHPQSPRLFELVEVPDVTVPGAWDAAVRGVAGIAHVVGAVEMSPQDADAAAAAELKWQVALLEAAAREDSVKSFALTASAWAAWTPDAARRGVVLGADSWNDEAVALARDASVPPQAKGMAGFMAVKTLVERGVWEWVRRTRPAFAFNTLLLDTVIGEVLDPRHQGIPSTAGMVHWVWEGKHAAILDSMAPQWHVDCRDAGRLFVAVLASSPLVDRERVFVFGARYSWRRVWEVLRTLYPDHEMKAPKETGWDQTEVPNERGEELLGRVGQTSGWTSLEESVKKNAASWLQLDGPVAADEKYMQLNGS
ncbi:hypothetical protein B0T24DRAFT_682697 [Lasiosphaeria ovina]|uniref:NAD-dependent epimerase/dehydratase domain-containing protein n=1 Tax=Lasiosphaeria ovina TaxID=92902 RepID=A0AAE0JX61_9PEZI|nr:hypothetical protein B0T24DRAFT_682697 [Lasiosphaeria ovina]